MLVENTRKNQMLQQAVASLVIDNMYVSKEFIEELMKVDKGEKTYEEIRQEIIKKHARQRILLSRFRCFDKMEAEIKLIEDRKVIRNNNRKI